jgi:hypothetical protein
MGLNLRTKKEACEYFQTTKITIGSDSVTKQGMVGDGLQ